MIRPRGTWEARIGVLLHSDGGLGVVGKGGADLWNCYSIYNRGLIEVL